MKNKYYFIFIFAFLIVLFIILNLNDWRINEKVGDVLFTSGETISLDGKQDAELTIVRGSKRLSMAALDAEMDFIYVLILYPPDVVVIGSGCGGSTNGWKGKSTYTWNVQKIPGSYAKYDKYKFSFNYNGRKNIISVGEKIYQISQGIFFVIKLDKKWEPKVLKQLNPNYSLPMSLEKILLTFKKSIPKDSVIQSLNLPKIDKHLQNSFKH